MNLRHKNGMPGCSACRGDYEDPDAAGEDEDSVEQTEEAIGE